MPDFSKNESVPTSYFYMQVGDLWMEIPLIFHFFDSNFFHRQYPRISCTQLRFAPQADCLRY